MTTKLQKGWTLVHEPSKNAQAKHPNETKAALFTALASVPKGVLTKTVRAIALAHGKGVGNQLLRGEDKAGDQGLRNVRDWYHSRSHVANAFGCVVMVKPGKAGIVDPMTRYKVQFADKEMQAVWSQRGKKLAIKAKVRLS